jgi:hypothetical protein
MEPTEVAMRRSLHRRLLVPLSLVAVLALTGSSCERVQPARRGEALRAGACAVEITPVVGVNHGDPIFMAGFSNARHATGVHDPLWARGVVIESGDTKIGLVVLDVVGYFNNEIQTIRSLVDPARGFDSITVSSTHTHEGPDTMGLWGPDESTTGVDPGYLDFVNDAVVQCLEEADDALAPAAVKFATGSSEGSSLPPWPDLVADGKILEELVVDLTFFNQGFVEVEGDDGPVINASVPVMQLRRFVHPRDRVQALLAWIFGAGPPPDLHPLGETIATVVNFASHPESLGADNTLITSDFPHYMREALEARYGGVALYVSADLGVLQGPLDVDVADADTGLPVPRRTFAFAERMGELLAERAVEALEGERVWNAGAPIAVAQDGPFFIEVENPYFVVLGALGVFGRREIEEQDEVQGIQTEVSVLTIGDASLVVTPNELDPQIGELYRERIGEGRHRFTVGLGNDEIGYQMPEAKYNPSCFACVLFVATGVPEACPAAATLDCSTTMQNNIGPGADPELQDRIGALIDATHP